jgi:hypothetical protein
MSLATRATSQALVLASLLLAGCAADGSSNFFTTGALGTSETAAAPESRVDPVCVTLASRIETLRKEGIAEKVEKAAAKKYTLTKADLGKADQLNKANSDFQQRCSTITPKPMSADITSTPPPPAPPAKAPKAAPKAASSAAAAPPSPQ